MSIVRDASLFPSVATALGLAVVAGGLVSFSGWAFDVPRLTDWFADGVSTQPNTAVLLTLAGAALVALHIGPRTVVAALGGFIALAGAVTLAQHLAGADFGFNHQLMFGRDWGQYTTTTPGRMGPPASTSFTLIGLAFLILGLRRLDAPRFRRLVPRLGVALLAIAALSIAGYLFDAAPFYTVPWLTAIALQTALMLSTIALGLVASVPEHHPLRLLLSDSGAGAMARRILPPLIALPPLLGWLRLKGESLGYFDAGTGRAVLILSMIILSVGLLWWALLALARYETADRERERARLREQKLVADNLRDADRRKNEFLAILAHELRGPLAPLRNTLELLKRSDSKDVPLERTRAIMERQLGHLARLVDDLLDVSRITRDRIEIRREPVDLRALVESCIEGARPAADEKRQQLTLSLPPEPIPVHADPVRLTQVFGNILHNAIKFTGSRGRIACAAGVEGAIAVVRIRDDGIGIPAEHLGTVFDMFTQLEPRPDHAQGGLGIGLTLARRLVELHGGSVTATSGGPGHGSEFVVRIPVQAAQPAQSAAHADIHIPPPARPLRFLVVDDNPDTAGSLAALLKFYGHDVDIASDGVEALAVAGRQRPDVVLLDIGMPRLDGYGACRRLREQPGGGQLLIVALTGWGEQSAREKSHAAGFDHHLVKPVDFAELMALVTSRSFAQPAA